MKKRIAIIVGHSIDNQGAIAYNGISEYEFNKQVSEYMDEEIDENSPIIIDIFWRDWTGMTFDDLIYEINIRKEYDMSLELHFNSFFQTVKGCECLILKDAKEESRIFADILTDELQKEYGINQRHKIKVYDEKKQSYLIDGVKEVGEGDRGWYNLEDLDMQANIPINLLFEPCFGNMETEQSKLIIEDPKRYAKFLVRTIKNKLYKFDDLKTTIQCIGYMYKKDDEDFVVVSDHKLVDHTYKYIGKIPIKGKVIK